MPNDALSNAPSQAAEAFNLLLLGSGWILALLRRQNTRINEPFRYSLIDLTYKTAEQEQAG